MTRLLFLLCLSLRSLVRKGESDIELRIESKDGIEGFAALALQTFDNGSFALGEKFCDLFVGKLLVANAAEHFQAAIHIAALGYLIEK